MMLGSAHYLQTVQENEMSLLFSNYEMPLFIVDDKANQKDIAYLYRYRFPRTRVSFANLEEYLLLQDSEPDMIRCAHDIVIAVDVAPHRYEELNESVTIWK